MGSGRTGQATGDKGRDGKSSAAPQEGPSTARHGSADGKAPAMSGPAQVREVWVTEHKVALHCATPARPYHRIVYRTKTGQRKFASGGAGPVTGRCDGPQHDQAWAKALEIDDALAASLRERRRTHRP